MSTSKSVIWLLIALSGAGSSIYSFMFGPSWLFFAGVLLFALGCRLAFVKHKCSDCGHLHYDASGKELHCIRCGATLDAGTVVRSPLSRRKLIIYLAFVAIFLLSAWLFAQGFRIVGIIVFLLSFAPLAFNLKRYECRECGLRAYGPEDALKNCHSCGAVYHPAHDEDPVEQSEP